MQPNLKTARGQTPLNEFLGYDDFRRASLHRAMEQRVYESFTFLQATILEITTTLTLVQF